MREGIINCQCIKPVSVNSMYSGNPHSKRRFITKEAKAWKQYIADSVQYELCGGKLQPESKPSMFEIWLHFTFPDQRKRDQSNYTKPILDALSGIIWDDDTQIYINHSSKEIKKGIWELYIAWRNVDIVEKNCQMNRIKKYFALTNAG